jgi:hypothetical protein
MAKIIFYNTAIEEKVNKFMASLNDGERREEQFITFDMLSARTGITAESKSSAVVSAIISVITMVNANIFVPFIEYIEDEIVTYVTNNKDSMAPIEFFYINEKGSDDSTTIELNDDEEIRYTMFVPKTVSVLYVSTLNRIEKAVQNISPKSRFMFDMPRIKEIAKIDDDTRIALAFPQITASSSLEFTKILEDALKINPVDAIIFEEDENGLDFFLRMVRNAVPNMEHRYYIDTPAYKIEEVAEDENDVEENVEPGSEEDEVIPPTVEAEVVSEES